MQVPGNHTEDVLVFDNHIGDEQVSGNHRVLVNDVVDHDRAYDKALDDRNKDVLALPHKF